MTLIHRFRQWKAIRRLHAQRMATLSSYEHRRYLERRAAALKGCGR